MRFPLPLRAQGDRTWRARAALTGVSLAIVLVLAACGSSTTSKTSTAAGGGSTASTSASRDTSTSTASRSTAAGPAPLIDELGPATHPSRGAFPATRGRTLRAMSKLAHSSVQLGAATGTFTPGTGRFAFGLSDTAGRYVYAPTVLYVASSPNSPAKGPFLAPADSMQVAPQYRSQQNTGPGGIKAIYSAELSLPKAGIYDLLALTRGPHGLIGAPGEVAVAASSPIPNVGQRPPAIATDTLATVHGDRALLTTRVPAENMASVSFKDVLGRKPVALLFSTPQLCTSRVCGPVTDVTVSEQHEFAGRVTFIHQEVYVNNDPAKGLRPQLTAFHLRTEPWLFAINRQGVIVARLEGAFGTTELHAALEAALR